MLSPLIPAAALEALSLTPDRRFLPLFRHGSLEVEIYKPVGVDEQKPHSRDEIYVVISGSGQFVKEETATPIAAGDVLFVPAWVEHRFVDFTPDFAVWVFFYGPEGGEAERG